MMDVDDVVSAICTMCSIIYSGSYNGGVIPSAAVQIRYAQYAHIYVHYQFEYSIHLFASYSSFTKSYGEYSRLQQYRQATVC